MCGIIGYIGNNVEQKLLKGLEKLEYRGYDSAGLCVLRHGNFYVEKSKGSVEKLREKTCVKSEFGLGIAHTRWATHGKITIENAHPHFSSKGEVALVHNGIIENFEELKSALEEKGVYFYGETDSEVAAKLLSGRLSLKKIQNLVKKIKGTYAFAIISKKNNSIYFAKNKSPLYVAIGKDCSMIASDPSCFVGVCDSFYPVDDGEYGKLDLKKVVFIDKHNKVVLKKSKKLDIDYFVDGKNGYEHFMLKEIYESKNVLGNIIQNYSSPLYKKLLEKVTEIDFNRVYFVGCGTAYHAGLIGQRYFMNNIKKDVFCERASEFSYQNRILDQKSLCVFISQSGETIDTIASLDYAKRCGAKIVSITNVSYSTIACKADINLPIFAGPEIAVASTKAFVGQCAVLFLLSKVLSGQNYIDDLVLLKEDLDFGDDEKLKRFAKKLASEEKVLFIGRGFDYITSLEASLKLKEISYINSIVEPSGELKHGPIALVEEGTILVVLATESELFIKTINNAYETKSRGAKLCLVTNQSVTETIQKEFDYVFKVKNTTSELMPVQTIVLLQKLAYYVAVTKKTNPDKPRNLAKSVTVE